MTSPMQLTIPVGEQEWMSANRRYSYWAQRSRRTKSIRIKTKLTALSMLRAGTLTPVNRARIEAQVCMPSNVRSDPGNAAPTVKAMIDGLVDAGVLPDDDKTHLIGPDYRPGPPTKQRGLYRIHLQIEPLPDPEEVTSHG